MHKCGIKSDLPKYHRVVLYRPLPQADPVQKIVLIQFPGFDDALFWHLLDGPQYMPELKSIIGTASMPPAGRVGVHEV